MRIAIIGTGIAGLAAAHRLRHHHELTLYEASERAGGHTNTVDVEVAGERLCVDTGFIVYNERNYPLFTGLLEELGIETQVSDMSFSVSHATKDFEYRPTTLNSLFACRTNLVRPSFHRMLVDIARFNGAARRVLERPGDERTLGELLAGGRFGSRVRDHFVLPLASAIWSADPAHLLDMPVSTYARFMANHGLLSFGDQPVWRTVRGGARRYVDALLGPLEGRVRLATPVDKLVRHTDGVEVHTAAHGTETYDALVVATHSDEARALLSDPRPEEIAVLSAIRYQSNVATLHTDASLLPRRRRVWASWNYHLLDTPKPYATLTYHMNLLQSLPCAQEVLVTLNRAEDIDPSKVLATFSYSHPVLDAAAVTAQARRREIQGRNRTWYCGAYWGYGFHEDGVRSGFEVANAIGPARGSSAPA